MKLNLAPKKPWIIEDWTGAIMFKGEDFVDFDEAEQFLSIFLKDSYETDRQEYEIKRKEFSLEHQVGRDATQLKRKEWLDGR